MKANEKEAMKLLSMGKFDSSLSVSEVMALLK